MSIIIKSVKEIGPYASERKDNVTGTFSQVTYPELAPLNINHARKNSMLTN